MTNYRPSDEEVAAAAAVIKAWGMDKGYHTTAVLALVAAAETRKRPEMTKRTDEQMVRFLDGIVGSVEATRNEEIHLYSLYTEELGKSWISNNCGLLETVGYIDDRPVCIALSTAVVDGHKILFWHATSQVVDHLLINKWLELNTPNNRTDACNFHNIFP